MKTPQPTKILRDSRNDDFVELLESMRKNGLLNQTEYEFAEYGLSAFCLKHCGLPKGAKCDVYGDVDIDYDHVILHLNANVRDLDDIDHSDEGFFCDADHASFALHGLAVEHSHSVPVRDYSSGGEYCSWQEKIFIYITDMSSARDFVKDLIEEGRKLA